MCTMPRWGGVDWISCHKTPNMMVKHSTNIGMCILARKVSTSTIKCKKNQLNWMSLQKVMSSQSLLVYFCKSSWSSTRLIFNLNGLRFSSNFNILHLDVEGTLSAIQKHQKLNLFYFLQSCNKKLKNTTNLQWHSFHLWCGISSISDIAPSCK